MTTISSFLWDYVRNRNQSISDSEVIPEQVKVTEQKTVDLPSTILNKNDHPTQLSEVNKRNVKMIDHNSVLLLIKIKQLENDKTKLTEKIEELDQTVQQAFEVMTEMESVKVSVETKAQEIKDEHAYLDRQYQFIEDKYQKTLLEINANNNEIRSLKNQQLELKEKINELDLKKEEFKQKNDELTEEIDKLQQKITVINQEKESLQEKIERKTQKYQVLQEYYEDLSKKCQELTGEKLAFKDSLIDLSQRYSQLVEKNHLIKENLDQFQASAALNKLSKEQKKYYVPSIFSSAMIGLNLVAKKMPVQTGLIYLTISGVVALSCLWRINKEHRLIEKVKNEYLLEHPTASIKEAIEYAINQVRLK